MANMIPDEIKNIDDLEKLSDKVEVIYDYIKYMREQLEFYSSAKKLGEIGDVSKQVTDIGAKLDAYLEENELQTEFHTIPSVSGVTVSHAHTRRRGNIVEVEMELSLDGTVSEWTAVLEGLPIPNYTIYSESEYWSSSYTRPLRTAVSSQDGAVRIRYGGAGSFDIHFTYLI